MTWRRWLAYRALGLCVVFVGMSAPAALAQLPDCETQGPLPHFKTDNPDPINQGNDLTYTITFSTFLEPTCYVFDDPLPVETTFQSLTASAGWTCTVPPVGSSGSVHCSIGPTGGQILTLVVRVDPGFSGQLTNVGTVSYAVAAACPPVTPNCTVQETTTVVVPVELIEFRVE